MPWLGLGATIAWNLSRHRRGKSTICSATRRALPAPVFLVGWEAFTRYMVRHILDGYDNRN